jgi:hypothetical protein
LSSANKKFQEEWKENYKTWENVFPEILSQFNQNDRDQLSLLNNIKQ